MTKGEQFASVFVGVISVLFGLGLIAAGFERDSNPGLPVAGAIIIFSLVYAEVNCS